MLAPSAHQSKRKLWLWKEVMQWNRYWCSRVWLALTLNDKELNDKEFQLIRYCVGCSNSTAATEPWGTRANVDPRSGWSLSLCQPVGCGRHKETAKTGAWNSRWSADGSYRGISPTPPSTHPELRARVSASVCFCDLLNSREKRMASINQAHTLCVMGGSVGIICN